jgi:hypothetical protein
VRSADASKIEVVSKVETPKVESAPLDLRRSTD